MKNLKGRFLGLGDEHRRHIKGYPFIYIRVRIPGPSWMANLCISCIKPFISPQCMLLIIL
ncbi:MAG: hypothetical protein ACFE94_14385 [Candidatus Hodarchaeota archaeon]